MSIIQEALKKAQGEIGDTDGSTVPARQSRVSDAAGALDVKNAQPSLRKPTVERVAISHKHDPKAVAILLVVLIAIAYMAASQLFGHKKVVAKSSMPVQSPMPAGLAVAVTSPDSAAISTDSGIAGAKSVKFEDVALIPSIIFQKPEEKKLAYPDFALNGIMYVEGAPRAIVNNSMVEVGDTVDGAKVLRIEKRSVVLQHSGSEITLSLK